MAAAFTHQAKQQCSLCAHPKLCVLQIGAALVLMDLCCHKTMKLSLMQAAFHGVPVVGIPVFGDQPDNVMKAVYRGFGIMISPGVFSPLTGRPS